MSYNTIYLQKQIVYFTVCDMYVLNIKLSSYHTHYMIKLLSEVLVASAGPLLHSSREFIWYDAYVCVALTYIY